MNTCVLKSCKCEHETTHFKNSGWQHPLPSASYVIRLSDSTITRFLNPLGIFSDLPCVLNISSTLAMNFSFSRNTGQKFSHLIMSI